VRKEGAYLLRAHWTQTDPAKLWEAYTQLTHAEAAFRTLKSEVNLHPTWHWMQSRVEAHILVAFLGYCLWVYMKKSCERIALSLTPWALLDQLRRIQLVEVWFVGLPSYCRQSSKRLKGCQWFRFSKSTGEKYPMEEWRRRRL